MSRARERDAAVGKKFDIRLHGWVTVHSGIHGWRENHGPAKRQKLGRKKVIGKSLREACDRISRGRRDKYEIRPACGGDVMVAVGGQPVGDADELHAHLGPDRVGGQLTLRLIRGGQMRDLAVTVGERP